MSFRIYTDDEGKLIMQEELKRLDLTVLIKNSHLTNIHVEKTIYVTFSLEVYGTE